MSRAPVPTPKVLWRKPSVLAIAALPGTTLGRLGGPSTGSSAAWAAAGAAIRKLHDAPLPPRPGRAGRSTIALTAELDAECELLASRGLLPADLVTRNRQVSEAALRPWNPAFTHGDLQIAHVFVDGDEVTGIIDWSEAGQGDALYDLATFTLGHEEHLDDVLMRLWHRHRPRRDPRMVVLAKPAGSSLADRARLRPLRARLRGRCTEIPDVRLSACARSVSMRLDRDRDERNPLHCLSRCRRRECRSIPDTWATTSPSPRHTHAHTRSSRFRYRGHGDSC